LVQVHKEKKKRESRSAGRKKRGKVRALGPHLYQDVRPEKKKKKGGKSSTPVLGQRRRGGGGEKKGFAAAVLSPSCRRKGREEEEGGRASPLCQKSLHRFLNLRRPHSARQRRKKEKKEKKESGLLHLARSLREGEGKRGGACSPPEQYEKRGRRGREKTQLSSSARGKGGGGSV